MRCVKCAAWSWRIICASCAAVLSEFEQGTRLAGDLKVYYFYKYSDVKSLILYKHKFCGHFIYQKLAALSFAPFAKSLDLNTQIAAVPLDDSTKNGGWSHTAVLARSLKTAHIRPIYAALRARNPVKYAGTTLRFREQNPRDYAVLKRIDRPIILVDDIITTGESMKQAANTLKKAGARVLFGLVLADAREVD